MRARPEAVFFFLTPVRGDFLLLADACVLVSERDIASLVVPVVEQTPIERESTISFEGLVGNAVTSDRLGTRGPSKSSLDATAGEVAGLGVSTGFCEGCTPRVARTVSRGVPVT